jgi:hypothetical protein
MDRTSADQSWWLYRWEDGQLRIVGRARIWKQSKNLNDTGELIVERLALGNLWSTTAFFAKYETEKTFDLLGPVYCSQELLRADFEGLPAHRLQLFREGLPWIGMSERLIRINMRSCSKAILEWEKGANNFQDEQTIACNMWKVTLREGRITAILR